ncbi:MAG: UDP-glucose/GDP-mannose dehydrogenase family protein [Chitinophagales bacterium]|jgi:UDPglucose 6-dehydrogenase|nr:UDP-glucose/GDP-mannose dehydrogenase family protein [Chitinophagales bacterium]
MNIAIVGTGYVGLVTGTCFAEMGNNVICVDIDKQKVAKLQSGQVTIFEPGLETVFERNVNQHRLHFTTDLGQAVEKAQIIFLALPTPPGEDGSADLSYVLGVAKQLGKLIKDYKVVVNKSTVPVGTAELVRQAIAQNATVSFDVVSNPEFLREGMAVDDFMKPDRVVIGTTAKRAQVLMRALYEPFVRQGNPIYMMDERSAELTKYAANSYLATRITFMNEIANLCELVGADIDMVRAGMGSDSRIGKRFLFPGVGYGGSCFPKDVSALFKIAEAHHYDFEILRSVLHVNDRQRISLVPKLKNYFGDDLSGKHFALWGLSFKPNTDDIREAPALYIIRQLLDAGATITAYDPEGMENTHRELGDAIRYASDQYAALHNADALLIATEWQAFRTPDFDKMASFMRHKAIFDGRNLYNLDIIQETGFYYNSIGRRVVVPTTKPSKNGASKSTEEAKLA